MNRMPRIGSHAFGQVASLWPFLRAVFRAISWRNLLLAELAAAVILLIRWLEGVAGRSGSLFMSGVVICGLGGALVLVAALGAEEALRRGIRAWLAYPIALLAASWGTAISQWYMRGWFGLHTAINRPGVPTEIQWSQVYFVVLDVIVFGGLAMLAYRSGQNGKRMMERVRTYALERVQVERRLIESRLIAAQVQVDPQQLVDSLADIHDRYRTSPLGAERRLDALIHSLQSAMVRDASMLTPLQSDYENPDGHHR